MKSCTKCKAVKPLSAFTLRPERNNRPHSQCKKCRVAKSKESRETPIGRSLQAAYARDYNQRAGVKDRKRKNYIKFITSKTPKAIAYNQRKKEKQIISGERKAHGAVSVAKESGEIFKKGICAGCFRPKFTEFHHFMGYRPENWLDVVELCRSCHYEAHIDIAHEYHPRKAGNEISL